MAAKWIVTYAAVFLLVTGAALLASGTLQHGILPRLRGAGPAAGAAAGEAPAADLAPAHLKPAPASPPAPAPATPASPPSPAGPAGASGGEADPGARLARLYEGMRPKEAADVLQRLEPPLAAALLARMRERQAAKVLGAMSPAAAAELTRLLQAPGNPS